MRSPDEKAKFSSSVGQDVIEEALKSVERSEKGLPPAESAVAGTAAQPTPVGEPQTSELEELKTQLEMSMSRGRDLMGKLKDEHEKLLRAVADLENFKKRALKEKDEVQRFGVEKLVKDFIPVFDNLDRALEHARAPEDYESLKKGVEMIRRLFEDTLGKHGVKTFQAKGKPFDPNFHEAMTQAETTELPPNHVFADVIRGFTLNDRLVRPALVVVSRAPAPKAAQPLVPAEPAAPKQESDAASPKSDT